MLDPACGSGNFLYIALQLLKDLERDAIAWGSLVLQTPQQFPQIGPQNLLGIEINPYAAELARVTIWIGELQWMLSRGFSYRRDPILQPLDNIREADALLDLSDPTRPQEAAWPDADVVIGNPPFLGHKVMRAGLGDAYLSALFAVYKDRLPAQSDLCCYWHEKARGQIAAGCLARAGLLATQGIRGQGNRRVLQRIKSSGNIFFAYSDEPWVLFGAAVHIRYVGQDNGTQTDRTLNGRPVTEINANLTAGLDLTLARRLAENAGIAFQGPVKVGPFDVDGAVARALLAAPNPDGRLNSDVVRPWANGLDLSGPPRGMWIIDFGPDSPIETAALYEAPFEYVRTHVEPRRSANRNASRRAAWWRLGASADDLRAALEALPRFLATVRHSKHRLFVWLPADTLPDSALIAFARDDDYTFGVLHGRAHELWARATGTQVREAESGFRYTPTTCFETFPFPDPSEAQRRAIADAAQDLDQLRTGWLNPHGQPEAELRERTLTHLYNARPAWLAQAHERLDRAVFDAYGWVDQPSDEEILRRLLDLNLAHLAA